MKQLYPYQSEVVPLLGTRNFLLADDAGLGKTLVALTAAHQYATGPILVVCPRMLKAWWAQSVADQYPEDANKVFVAGRGGRGLPFASAKGAGRCWFITHYEGLRMQVRANKFPLRGWDWVICDEAHRVKNRKAKVTKALWRLQPRRKIALTATPYGRSPSDMWALLHWLYPRGPEDAPDDQRQLYTSYWKFFGTFVDSYKPPGRPYHIERGPRNLSYLAQVLAPYYKRRTKDEVLDLPPLTYADVPVEINSKQEALYLQLLKESYAELCGQEVILENALVRMIRLHQCALDPRLVVDTGQVFPLGELPAKVRWLQEWLDDHPAEPVIIVSRYRKFVEFWLQDLAPEAVVVGGMTPKQHVAAFEAFERTGRLVGSIQALCEGLNLQAAATIIVTDGTWSPTVAYQMSQRIHRIGQTKHCQIIHLVGKLAGGRKSWTVDRLVRRALARRMSEAEIVNDFVKEIQEVGYE